MEWVSRFLILLALSATLSGKAVVKPDHPLIFNEDQSDRYVPSNVLEAEENSHNTTVLIGDKFISLTEQCYEEPMKYDIIYQTAWKPAQNNEAIRMFEPANFVVVLDGEEGCYSKADCIYDVQQQATPNLPDGCKLRENFYIGGDGNIYEGRGWKISPYWYLSGLRNQSLAVKFTGNHESKLPSHKALQAFKSLLVAGVWLGTLSPRYQIVSIRQLAETEATVGEILHENVQEWSGWVNDEVPMSRWEYQPQGFLNLVFRREWNATEPLREPEGATQPVSYVLLNNVGQRCHSRKECISLMKSLQQSHREDYGDLLDNFYIGEDGNVYEGRGWDYLPQWYVKGMRWSYVSVSFLGAFDSEIPAYRAITSFKELISTGLRLGKLSTLYKLTSLRMIYDDQVLLGDALHTYVQKWTPWAHIYDELTIEGRMEADLVPLIRRSGWIYEMPPAPTFKKIEPSFPVEFILIQDGGEACFYLTDCMDNMNSERNDLLYNFYVGGDGIVYEGRGWEDSPPLYLKHFHHSYITIKFFGTYNDTVPNNMTMQAFRSFIKLGIDTGKISPSYQLYSLRHIYNDSTFLGSALSEYAEGLPQWSSEMEINDDQERLSRGMLPLVSRDDWNATSLGEKFLEIKGQVHYVLVGATGGEKCYSWSECILRIQEQQRRGKDLCDSVTDHFYIGDDGNFYEALGWAEYSGDISEQSQERAISVRFFGSFQHDIPSRLAMSALGRFLEYGISTGKLSEDYEVKTYRQLCNCSSELGDRFQRVIESLDRFSNETISLNVSGSLPYNPFLIVPNTNNKSYSATSRRTNSVSRPATYIVISDGGERCFDQDQCLTQVKALPSGRDDYENFFIGEDGRSYEGSGWSTNVYGRRFCPDCETIFIGFLGKFNYDLPSSTALNAMNYLIKGGIRWGKVHPDYTLVSIRQLCSNCSLVGDSLNIAIRTWSNWNEQINITAECELFESEIVPRNVWRNYHQDFSSNRNYRRSNVYGTIVVSNSYAHCNNKEECIAWLRNHDSNSPETNFYISGNGNVYQCLGWDYIRGITNSRHRWDPPEPDTLKVEFIGDFDSRVSADAMTQAFRKLIVNKGIENGNLRSSYTLSGVLIGIYGDETYDMLG
ncbi:uncharacterized protein LOC124169042 [Ischnura elegans]|uniref:uncharacterized protein LOC124169042 n=1 Tax=Ischnura elegans TaxID=197161 RepID=UPI001ED88DF2|nr:uncharacterized protein LOC124169042 [Ischnura elegans]XP_046403467.1 uncharacterized protein LOC124169042 [Ischnura elegans]